MGGYLRRLIIGSNTVDRFAARNAKCGPGRLCDGEPARQRRDACQFNISRRRMGTPRRPVVDGPQFSLDLSLIYRNAWFTSHPMDGHFTSNKKQELCMTKGSAGRMRQRRPRSTPSRGASTWQGQTRVFLVPLLLRSVSRRRRGALPQLRQLRPPVHHRLTPRQEPEGLQEFTSRLLCPFAPSASAPADSPATATATTAAASCVTSAGPLRPAITLQAASNSARHLRPQRRSESDRER